MAAIVDSEQFKQALSTLPTGVTIITTLYNNKLFGFTADSFTSVSLLPPLVLFCINKKSFSMSAFTGSEYFAVSVLAENQEDISRHFSKFNTDKFAGISYNLGQITNCPLIEGAVCHIECNKFSQYEVGDHVILVGKVISTMVKSNLKPLVHCLRQYRELK
ncbi:MAG TPA: flavin reductase family protein [Rickettsia endosymbiont of Sericostoma sp.]|uniref:flavin reductase family protein n=1 Tax=unclassified Candidatus Tisiphia TaxID=2996318 RepID=UPI001DD0331C|nr:flavin reductase family protein [Rickettsia endosymbiont of Sericostoma sp.]